MGFPGFQQAGADQQPASNAGREERGAVDAASRWRHTDELPDHRLGWLRHKHVPGVSQWLRPAPAAARDMLKGDVIQRGFVGALLVQIKSTGSNLQASYRLPIFCRDE